MWRKSWKKIKQGCLYCKTWKLLLPDSVQTGRQGENRADNKEKKHLGNNIWETSMRCEVRQKRQTVGGKQSSEMTHWSSGSPLSLLLYHYLCFFEAGSHSHGSLAPLRGLFLGGGGGVKPGWMQRWKVVELCVRAAVTVLHFSLQSTWTCVLQSATLNSANEHFSRLASLEKQSWAWSKFVLLLFYLCIFSFCLYVLHESNFQLIWGMCPCMVKCDSPCPGLH